MITTCQAFYLKTQEMSPLKLEMRSYWAFHFAVSYYTGHSVSDVSWWSLFQDEMLCSIAFCMALKKHLQYWARSISECFEALWCLIFCKQNFLKNIPYYQSIGHTKHIWAHLDHTLGVVVYLFCKVLKFLLLWSQVYFKKLLQKKLLGLWKKISKWSKWKINLGIFLVIFTNYLCPLRLNLF